MVCAVPGGREQVMADKVTGPLGPRRAIATNLKRLREESGQSLNDVATPLMISTSKLSRLENAQGKPNPRDIRDLISPLQHPGHLARQIDDSVGQKCPGARLVDQLR